MTKALATTEQTALATQGASNALTPMQKVGQELALVPGVDEEYQYSMRKLGTIHLGVKMKTADGRKEYPKAVDYFVLPEQLRQDPEFREKLESMGQDPDRPTKLPIFLMSDDLSVNIIRCCELWGTGAKLKCRATPFRLPNNAVGLRCIRLNPKSLDYEEAACVQSDCADLKNGNCAWVTKIRFMLPDQSRIGYWEIITKSDNNKGAIAREMLDLRNMLNGRIAGVDLALVLTNERIFHPKVKDRSGKITRMQTQPWLLHMELGKSMRKIMAEGRTGHVVDAEIIHESYDLDEEPEATEDEFAVGEAPETPTAQVEDAPEVTDAEFTAAEDPLPEPDPQPQPKAGPDTNTSDVRKEKLAACRTLGAAIGLNNSDLVREIANASLPAIQPKEMSLDQLQQLYDHLFKMANDLAESVVTDPFV